MSTVDIDTFKKIMWNDLFFQEEAIPQKMSGTGLWAQRAKRKQTQIAYYNRFQQVAHLQTQIALRIPVI